MMPGGGSGKKPALRQRYPSAAASEEFSPRGWGRWKRLPGGSWERNQLMCWHSPAPRRIGVGHVCGCVYLGALAHRQEFPAGYTLLSQDLEAVKERWLRGASLDHRAQPAATPQLLPCIAQPPPAPCAHLHEPDPHPAPVQLCLHLLDTLEQQAALTVPI